MAKRDGGELIARVMRENRVRYCFAINGGHLFPILAQLRDNDIKLIHMRHEQATAYAADAYARSSGEVGVCMVTAGCGLTNAVTGLCVAGLTNSAVVCISGQHPNTEDHLGSFQEAYGSEVVKSFSKFTKRVTDWSSIEFDLRSAFREAISPPQGVALFEIPQNILYHHEEEAGQRKGARGFTLDDVRGAGDPAKIDRAVEMLHAAERPVIAGGDGLFWSQAGAELREFVELTGIPVYTRRAGQGAVSEEHPLAIRGAWKKPFTGKADVVLAVGFRFWSGEHFGQPPTWTDKAKYIQVDPTPTRIGWQVNADLPIVGDCKLVLRQMIDRIKELKLDFSKNKSSEWTKEVGATRARFEAQIKEQNGKVIANKPIHPARLCEDLIKVLDKNATTIIDSFTLSGWMSRAFTCRFMGQVVDAGPLAPVGHGVGMGIGAQLARPGQQVVVIEGDGGLGIGGFDMETAARYKLPILT
ncbi:MAG: thiamine pyrophosphate-binding protein, partial [Candidatus Binataceae bacterium]